MKQALAVLSGGAAGLWAVIAVETSGCGFLPDGRTKILFERHVFSKHTGGRFDTKHPDISNPGPGDCLGDAGEYTRLRRALALDRQAALLATSCGLGQVMGYNATYAGSPTVGAMVEACGASESAQVVGKRVRRPARPAPLGRARRPRDPCVDGSRPPIAGPSPSLWATRTHDRPLRQKECRAERCDAG